MIATLFLMAVLNLPADGLQQRVEFWKTVFTTYGEEHLIFHDRHHVHLVYDVLDLKAAGIDLKDRNGQRQAETIHRQRIDQAMTDISSKAPAAWSDFTRSIAEKIHGSGISDKPAVLAARIHVQRGIREKFADSLKRYSQIGRTIEGILREEGISEDFAALPLVESGYMNTALSRTGAAGIWQFMPATARQYMKVSESVDQRLDPVIATRSAARLLLSNYSVLNNWPLAITAYNHGLAGMQRARQQCGERFATVIECYRGPSFGYASMNFYPEFLAALELLKDYRRHSPPAIAGAQPIAAPEKPAVQEYRVRKGDTLIQLSRKFATTPQQLMVLNRMDNPRRLIAGRVILVPKG